jgi:hypothetical protein
MTDKHTPGPWIFCGTHVDDSHGLPLVRDMRTWDKVNCYDHRLIAAAPDLLEACEAYYYGRKENRECEAMMRAAIAKATGVAT